VGRDADTAGIVEAPAIVLAGSAVGRIAPKNLRITGDVHDGDAIIFLASSACRRTASRFAGRSRTQLPQGYQTPVGDGRTYARRCWPVVIYVAFVRECQRRGLKLNYVAQSRVTAGGS